MSDLWCAYEDGQPPSKCVVCALFLFHLGLESHSQRDKLPCMCSVSISYSKVKCWVSCGTRDPLRCGPWNSRPLRTLTSHSCLTLVLHNDKKCAFKCVARILDCVNLTSVGDIWRNARLFRAAWNGITHYAVRANGAIVWEVNYSCKTKEKNLIGLTSTRNLGVSRLVHR